MEVKLRAKLISLLDQGALEYDYLKGSSHVEKDLIQLCDQVSTLLDYAIKEKKSVDQKYVKLLELHNKLGDDLKENDKYEPDSVYKLADENEQLKNEINKLLKNKM